MKIKKAHIKSEYLFLISNDTSIIKTAGCHPLLRVHPNPAIKQWQKKGKVQNAVSMRGGVNMRRDSADGETWAPPHPFIIKFTKKILNTTVVAIMAETTAAMSC